MINKVAAVNQYVLFDCMNRLTSTHRRSLFDSILFILTVGQHIMEKYL